MLGNSLKGLIPTQKRLLYQCCILLIALYGFQLWYFNKVLLSYPLRVLRNMQRKAALWILGAFYISPSFGIEAIARIIPTYLNIQRLNSRFQLRAHSLPINHTIKLLLKARPLNSIEVHHILLEELMPKEHWNIQGPIVDINNRFNKIIPSFSLFNYEFLLGNRLIDIFPNQFSFHSLDRKSKNSVKSHLHNLENISLQLSLDLHVVIIILDASIKNNAVTSIAYVHIYDSSVIKTIYHVVNVTSTEVEIFALRCSINQATQVLDTNQIVVIIDSIYATKRIFDSLPHLYQASSAAISCELREFFEQSINNSIEFWDYPSHCNWGLYTIVNKETKQFNLTPTFPCKSSWDLSKKNK